MSSMSAPNPWHTDFQHEEAEAANPPSVWASGPHGRFTEYTVEPLNADHWPASLGKAAYHGLAGEFVHAIEDHTESDSVATLLQYVVAFGNAIGRHAFFQVEATKHYLNLYLVLVGETANARKGTSLGHVRKQFSFAAREWEEHNIDSGLSSGEGLVWAVRDSTYDKDGEIDELGVEDKRRLVVQSEFAAVLKMLGRDGNTLSALLREHGTARRSRS